MITRKHLKVNLDHRIIVISDIHGNLDLFLKLLQKCQIKEEDTLIILGDLIEKGPRILDTLHYFEELSKRKQVYLLIGNCEWAIYNMVYNKAYANFLHSYLKRQNYSIFKEVLALYHQDPSLLSGIELQAFFQDKMKRELAFINSLITTLETKDYLFVHAGIEQRVDYENSSLSALLEKQRFMDQSHPLSKYVVVGHFPIANYHHYHLDNSIIINHEKRIISIDGGNQVKKIGQLNALIIDSSLSFMEVHIDYPKAIVKKDYLAKKHHHHKISWPDYEIEIIERGEEFCLCKKVNQSEILKIKNESIHSINGHFYGEEDYVDYQMSILKGNEVEVIEFQGSYAYILFQKELAWIPSHYLELKK